MSDSYQVSTHYIARSFAQHDWDVLWLCRPWHPYAFLNPRGLKDKTAKLKTWIRRRPIQEAARLYSYAFATLAPYKNLPLLRNPWVGRHSLRCALPRVRQKLRKIGFDEPDLLWVSDIAQYSILDLVSCSRTVLHITDDYLSFSTTPRSFLAVESWAVKRATTIVVPSPKLANLIRQRHGMEPAKVVVLPHAVEVDPERLAPLPPEFGSIPHPRVIYLGALETWLDWDLIEESVGRLPSISFAFIGSARLPDPATASCIARLKKRQNVHFLGEMTHPEAMACVAEADAAIIPFQAPRPVRQGVPEERAQEPKSSAPESSLRLTEYALPMKLFEYAALGVPIVSTRDFWSDLSLDIRTPLFVAADPEGFCQSLVAALDSGSTNRARRRQAGIAFARANSWENRFESLLEHLRLPQPGPPPALTSGARRG